MSTTLLSLVLLTSLSALPTSNAGTRLDYEGRFEALKGDPAASRKSFGLTALVRPDADGRNSVYWVLREEGFGGWPWTGRFGRYQLDASGSAAGHQPSLLYVRESGKSVISIPPIRLPSEARLEDGAQWKLGKSEYEVSDGGQRSGHEAWRVRVSNAYGHQRTMWIDKQTGLLVALRANVTIGQGERHELQLDLAGSAALETGQAAKDQKLLDQLVALRDRLAVDPRSKDVNWSPKQLASLRKSLRDLKASEPQGAIASVLTTAIEDANDQKGRTNAVAVLREDVLGKPLAHLMLTTDDGRPFDQESLKKKVTVLHFWAYRDKPLEEPYGQVGYIDFLCRRRREDGVAVYGVAVNPKLAKPEQRFGAVQTAKRLKKFMNLSYPLLFDAGEGMKKLGDPRVTGAKLPLVVVVDRDGRVVHYHVGFYDVDPRKGIVELDDAITKALGR